MRCTIVGPEFWPVRSRAKKPMPGVARPLKMKSCIVFVARYCRAERSSAELEADLISINCGLGFSRPDKTDNPIAKPLPPSSLENVIFRASMPTIFPGCGSVNNVLNCRTSHAPTAWIKR